MTERAGPAASDTKHATLVMHSGGIDSTAALWHVLNNADSYGRIHVHHIHMQNIERRWEVEAMAVNAIYEYLREHSPVKFATSESTIAVPNFGMNFLYDVEAIGFVSGYMTSRDASITKVVIGATGTDWGRNSIPDTVERSKAMHNAFHRDEEDHSGTVKEFPHKHLTKQEVYDTLPPELARLTWSCRLPRFVDGKFIECGGVCKTCRGELREVIRRAHGQKEELV